MRLKAIAVLILILFISAGTLSADSTIDISGLQVPLIQGAKKLQSPGPKAQMRVAAYAVNSPLEQVIDFYSAFFKENGFLLIGGQGAGGLNVSAKKGAVMFTLRIFQEKGLVIVEFIW